MIEKEQNKKKKLIPVPQVVIYIINVVKSAAKDYLKWIFVSAMIALTGWVVYGVTQITSMPRKYRQLIIVDSLRDIRDRIHEKSDSVKDIQSASQYLSLKHKMDSIALQQNRFIYKMWYRIDSLSVKNNKFIFKSL